MAYLKIMSLSSSKLANSIALLLLMIWSTIATNSSTKYTGNEIKEENQDPRRTWPSLDAVPDRWLDISIDDKRDERDLQITSQYDKRADSTTRMATEAEMRVINGALALEGAYPWFVLMIAVTNGRATTKGCGASLIEKEWIVTAAHCNIEKDNYAWIGAHDAYGSDPYNTGELIAVEECFKPGEYAFPKNDIALCRLRTPSIMPTVQIAKSNLHIDHDVNLTVIGMGATSEGGSSTLKLAYGDVAYQSKKHCESKLKEFDSSSMFCAGGGDTDACRGDSGGPCVHYDPEGNPIQVGIVSWGVGCGKEGYPGVYADVRTQRNWIDTIMCSNWVNSKPSVCSGGSDIEETLPQTNPPTSLPTSVPTLDPTNMPSNLPSKLPTIHPTKAPIFHSKTEQISQSKTEQIIYPSKARSIPRKAKNAKKSKSARNPKARRQ